jgi:hypothetical protein
LGRDWRFLFPAVGRERRLGPFSTNFVGIGGRQLVFKERPALCSFHKINPLPAINEWPGFCKMKIMDVQQEDDMAYSGTDDFNRLLGHLAQTIGLGELDKTGDNVCSIATEDLVLSLINQSGTLILATNLGNRPSDTLDVSVKNAILRANVLYSGTMGGCLGLTEDGVVTFCYHYPLENLAEDRFTTIVDSFISATRFWTGRLAELALGGNRAASDPAEAPASRDSQWVKI